MRAPWQPPAPAQGEPDHLAVTVGVLGARSSASEAFFTAERGQLLELPEVHPRKQHCVERVVGTAWEAVLVSPVAAPAAIAAMTGVIS